VHSSARSRKRAASAPHPILLAGALSPLQPSCLWAPSNTTPVSIPRARHHAPAPSCLHLPGPTVLPLRGPPSRCKPTPTVPAPSHCRFLFHVYGEGVEPNAYEGARSCPAQWPCAVPDLRARCVNRSPRAGLFRCRRRLRALPLDTSVSECPIVYDISRGRALHLWWKRARSSTRIERMPHLPAGTLASSVRAHFARCGLNGVGLSVHFWGSECKQTNIRRIRLRFYLKTSWKTDCQVITEI